MRDPRVIMAAKKMRRGEVAARARRYAKWEKNPVVVPVRQKAARVAAKMFADSLPSLTQEISGKVYVNFVVEPEAIPVSDQAAVGKLVERHPLLTSSVSIVVTPGQYAGGTLLTIGPGRNTAVSRSRFRYGVLKPENTAEPVYLKPSQIVVKRDKRGFIEFVIQEGAEHNLSPLTVEMCGFGPKRKPKPKPVKPDVAKSTRSSISGELSDD